MCINSAWGIIIKEKRILLIKRGKNKPIDKHPNYWSLHGWKLEKNETLKETVVREVKEETGLKFLNPKLFSETIIWDTHFFNFTWESSWKIQIQEEECDWYSWYTYVETKQLLTSERIKKLLEKLNKENYIN